MRSRPLIWPALLVSFAALLQSTASASDGNRYRVDAIVFLDSGSTGSEQPLAATPAVPTGIPLDDTVRLTAAGITRLADAAFGLNDAWLHLRNTRRFKPLLRFAWVQTAAASGKPVAVDTPAGATGDTTHARSSGRLTTAALKSAFSLGSSIVASKAV